MVMPGWFPAIICNSFRDRANISSRKRYKRGFLEPLRRSKNETAHSLWAGYIIVATIQYTRHKEEIWVSFCALHCLSSFGVGGGFQDIRQGLLGWWEGAFVYISQFVLVWRYLFHVLFMREMGTWFQCLSNG